MATRPRKRQPTAAADPPPVQPAPALPKKRNRKPPQLTGLQRLFVTEYLVDLNATQAAIRAGYSKKSASRQGVDLLQIPHVAEAIRQRQAKRLSKVEATAERVLDELARIAFADLRDVATWTGSSVQLRPSDDIPPNAAIAIESVASGQWGPKITLHSKTKALELLAKHHGLLVDRVKVENPEDVARQFAEALRAMETSGAFPAPPAQVTP